MLNSYNSWIFLAVIEANKDLTLVKDYSWYKYFKDNFKSVFPLFGVVILYGIRALRTFIAKKEK